MALDAPTEKLGDAPAPLYDFLYRDTQRIASYYAQLFHEGHLTQSEKTHAIRDNRIGTLKATAGVVGGDIQTTSETQEALKEVFNPHDIVTVDLLTRLMQLLVKPGCDVQAADVGEVIQVRGRLVFLDKTMLEFASMGLDVVINDEKAKPKNKRDQANLAGLQMIQKALPKMPMTSSFMLFSDDGLTTAGTIKESGLDEPISGSYFKHGAEGIANVQIIGIKENGPGNLVELPSTQFLAGVSKALRILQDIFFPAAAVKLTPIAIYREVARK